MRPMTTDSTAREHQTTVLTRGREHQLCTHDRFMGGGP